MIKILIKRLSKEISLPKYETSGSSGMDLGSNIDANISPGKIAIIPTGLALSIPKGFEAQIRPRSGLAAKKKISVLNTPGTIDSDYRGEIGVILINHGKNNFDIERGMRIAQIIFQKLPEIEIIESETLSKTDRDKGGFGSTGLD